MVYRVLEGASFRNSDSGGDVLEVSEAVVSCFVSSSTSGSFGTCSSGVAAESASVFFSYINHYFVILLACNFNDQQCHLLLSTVIPKCML